MNRKSVRNVAMLLSALISISFISGYGLGSNPSSGSVDAVASASQKAPKPAPKPVVQPEALPIPVPAAPTLTPVQSELKETALSLMVLGKAVDLEGSPIILTKDGQTMLPLRKLGEGLGYAVRWDNLMQGAVLEKGTDVVVVKISNREYTWASLSHLFSKKPEVYMSRLYVPVDFITSNQMYQLNQTPTLITIDLAGVSAKQAITGEIEAVTVFSNGLELEVEDNKDTVYVLYVTDATKIMHYSTDDPISRSMLSTGTKAIFSYTTVSGEGQSIFNILTSIEVVELASVPEAAVPDVEDNEDDDEDDDD